MGKSGCACLAATSGAISARVNHTAARMEGQDAAHVSGRALMKPWSEMTEKEIRKIADRDCAQCKYSSVQTSFKRYGDRKARTYTCNYILKTQKKRPCRPGECREAGVFEPKRKNARKG